MEVTFLFCCCLLQGIESRLKVTLPDDLPASLSDGVVLCHLINHIRKGMIPSIHIPSAGVVSMRWSKQLHEMIDRSIVFL